jgi:hypothetical protein
MARFVPAEDLGWPDGAAKQQVGSQGIDAHVPNKTEAE